MKSTLLDRISWFVVGVAPGWQPFCRLLLKRPPLVEPSREEGSTGGISSDIAAGAAGSLGPLPSTCPAAPKVREFVRKVARNSLASAAGWEAGEGRPGCR